MKTDTFLNAITGGLVGGTNPTVYVEIDGELFPVIDTRADADAVTLVIGRECTPRSDMAAINLLTTIIRNPYAISGCNDHSTWCNFCRKSGVSRSEIIPTQHEPTCIIRQAVELLVSLAEADPQWIQNQSAYEALT